METQVLYLGAGPLNFLSSMKCESEFANIVSGVFAPVQAKHSKSLNLIDTLAVSAAEFSVISSQCSARLKAGDRAMNAPS